MKEVDDLLSKKNLGNYKKACKIIVEKELNEYKDVLLTHLLEILKDPKKWESICVLIKALGMLRQGSLVEILERIFEEREEHDMVTMVAATAYVRIKREHLNDAKPVIDLIKKGTYSMKEGALEALGYDKMVPTEEEQEIIIKSVWDFGKERDRNAFTDPRYGLAAACAGWTVPIKREFLKECLSSKDEPLKYVAEKSLVGKYVKLR